nr:MAG: hypothetical protein H4Bulk462138_000001 [Mitovirus sp.]
MEMSKTPLQLTAWAPVTSTVGTKSRPHLGGPTLSYHRICGFGQGTFSTRLSQPGTETPWASDGTNVLKLSFPLSCACRVAAGLMSGRLTPYPFVTRKLAYRETIINYRDKYAIQGYYSC